MKSPPRISKLRNSNKSSHDKSTSADEFGAAARYAKQQWANFLEFVDSRNHTRCVFRGCGSVSHNCLPSIGRFEEYDQLQEIRLFHAFKRSASLFLDRMPANDWEWLALAQHTAFQLAFSTGHQTHLLRVFLQWRVPHMTKTLLFMLIRLRTTRSLIPMLRKAPLRFRQ